MIISHCTKGLSTTGKPNETCDLDWRWADLLPHLLPQISQVQQPASVQRVLDIWALSRAERHRWAHNFFSRTAVECTAQGTGPIGELQRQNPNWEGKLQRNETLGVAICHHEWYSSDVICSWLVYRSILSLEIRTWTCHRAGAQFHMKISPSWGSKIHLHITLDRPRPANLSLLQVDHLGGRCRRIAAGKSAARELVVTMWLRITLKLRWFCTERA